MRGFMAGVSAVLMLVCGQATAATVYMCKFERTAGAPQPGKYSMIIAYDEASDSALAMDAWTKHDKRKEGPFEARVVRQSDHVVRLSWTVADVRFESYSSDLDFTVFLDTQSNRVDATISPVSYPPPLHFVGACTTEKVK